MSNWSADKYFFRKALTYLYPNEGGFVDDPVDRGGRTNMGVTQGTYNDYRRKHKMAQKDVANITKGEATDIYYEEYWKKMGCDEIAKNDPQKALVLFDGAIQHGVGGMRDITQIYGDGDYKHILNARDSYYRKTIENDISQKRYEQGWKNRMVDLRDFADNKIMTDKYGYKLYNLGYGDFVTENAMENLQGRDKLYLKMKWETCSK